MIAGIGVDLANVPRVEGLLSRHGDRFVRRILTEAEVAEIGSTGRPARFIAKRFAAKEAFSKAWGTGIGADLGWHDVAIAHDTRGKPSIVPSARLAAALRARGLRAHVTLTDEADHALAFVVLEKD
jgi:holo-[acyl-carrier protein] synthase